MLSPDYMEINLYWRGRGVVCYDIEMLPNSEMAMNLPYQLLNSNLKWYWSSAARSLASDKMAPDESEFRPNTLLDSATLNKFADDLHEMNEDYERRDLVLIATDLCDSIMESESIFFDNMERFSQEEMSSIHLVLVQVGDLRGISIFVPRHPYSEIAELLTQWRVAPDNIAHVRRYNPNVPDMLETMYRLPGSREYRQGEKRRWLLPR